ncbi:MAG TPA: SseB family protein [Streptosporangiaceae bacterium]|nr:SseB family protein [Streptosporangiaceae bacterium]
MLGRNIPQPRYAHDDGRADPRVTAALYAYARGRAGEHEVLTALADARLLIPVVAVPAETERGMAVTPPRPPPAGRPGGEKHSEMALPTLIGQDGRRGVLGFTSVETLRRWRPEARPVAVHARDACRAVLDENAHALVVDIAGPVQFAIDGNRLYTFAEGRPIPQPFEDPDLLAAIEAAFAMESQVIGVKVGPGTSAELSVRFSLSAGADEQTTVQRVADRLAGELRGRIIGGVEVAVTHWP